MKKVRDPFTGEEFTPKRSNQVYANRQNQIAHNNLKARIRRLATAETDRKLHNNRAILERLLNGRNVVFQSREYLLGAGYDFELLTKTFEMEGKIWCRVYNYAIASYSIPRGERFKIINLNDRI